MNNVRIRNFGLTNDPPCLYVYYYVNNGKSRRRKIPVREIPRGIREGVFTLDLDRMVDELLKRHGEYLQHIPQETLLDALARMLNFQHLDTVSRKYKLPLVTHENHPVAYPLKKSSTDSKQHAPKPPNVTGAKPALDKVRFSNCRKYLTLETNGKRISPRLSRIMWRNRCHQSPPH